MLRITTFALAISAALTATAVSANTKLASYYGDDDGFHGKQMANGRYFDQFDRTTTAHKTLPFCTQVRVRGPNGRELTLVVRDRGPFHGNRELDVSTAAAIELGFKRAGTAQLRVLEIIPPVARHRYGRPCDPYLG